MSELRHVGPMAQDVMQRFPDKVVAGPDGYLRIKLDDLPPGLTAFDLYQPVHPADHAAAMARWQKVFEHWNRKS